ncbi:ABC transporter permease [Bacillus norwichensis]|uniref:ABC transporter permease n=1 Tax=Bacillus norwichensis TaxID=2762217 RepID=A0ABR8VNZ2_9BACI|nr:ABC transporter permease [Bacillus norwichensis]MBD8006475.1 ABC transporter permease [Bacillus norwichensis]
MLTKSSIRTYGAVLVIVICLNFLLPRLLPGGPLDYIEGSDSGAIVTEAQRNAILEYYQLNESTTVQFLHYVKGVFTFDFGISFIYKAPVRDLLISYLPNTLLIVGIASVISTIIGIIAGLLAGWWNGRKMEQSLLYAVLTISAIPEFLIGLVLLLLLAVQVQWFPLSGAQTPFLRDATWWHMVIDRMYHATLPIITLVVVNIASVYLMMRNSAIEILREPFIEFAKVKGISRKRILLTHLGKAAILPVFTLIMIRLSTLFTGAVFVETVFSYPGIGRLLQEAIMARDYPLMHGLFFVFTIIVLLFNAIADVMYVRLDPRMKSGAEE